MHNRKLPSALLKRSNTEVEEFQETVAEIKQLTQEQLIGLELYFNQTSPDSAAELLPSVANAQGEARERAIEELAISLLKEKDS